ncbi:unnamed protein product [Cyprideis torosa]|uniref:Uncharacterized protein n=1 Tax=Cyprideis torosa TaxID=163714 RepID=A0A7R8WCK0_9CRUS|nr:unnamed protein product [Cyprideis torosa]CAG0890909.1 unnamed protein product [Cyprideis torosa]
MWYGFAALSKQSFVLCAMFISLPSLSLEVNGCFNCRRSESAGTKWYFWMPELPELFLSARRVTSWCDGVTFSGAVEKSEVSKNPGIPWDSDAYRISAVSRGKELRLDLQDEENADKFLQIRFRFGMSGRFELTSPDDIHKHSHLRFFSKCGNRVLSFIDMRRFGTWEVTSDWGSNRGPCPVREYEEFRSNVLKALEVSPRNFRHKPICEIMHDQRFVNGIGNYLRAEILFRLNKVELKFRSPLTMVDPPTTSTPSSGSTPPSGADANVMHMSIKPPQFSNTHVAGWFEILEAQFELSRITNDQTKYYHTLAALPADTVGKLSSELLQNKDYELGQLADDIVPLTRSGPVNAIAHSSRERESGTSGERDSSRGRSRQRVDLQAGIPPFTDAEEALTKGSESATDGGEDLLSLCRSVPLEVIDEDFSYEGDDEESGFAAWLRCYMKPGMNNLVDKQKRTIWFAGEPGSLASGVMLSRHRKVTSRNSAAKIAKSSGLPKVGRKQSISETNETDQKKIEDLILEAHEGLGVLRRQTFIWNSYSVSDCEASCDGNPQAERGGAPSSSPQNRPW